MSREADACGLDAKNVVRRNVDDGPEVGAREDRGEQQRPPIVVATALDFRHDRTATRQPAEAGGLTLELEAQGRIVIVRRGRTREHRTHGVRRHVIAHARGLGQRERKAAEVDDRRGRAIALGCHEPDLGVEEAKGALLERVDVETCIEALKKHQVSVRRFRRARVLFAKDAVLVEERIVVVVSHAARLVDRERFSHENPDARDSIVLIDTHCHLDGEYFPDGPEPVLARARAAGVGGFVVVGVGHSLAAARSAVALARSNPVEIAATVGVHPHDASTCDEPMLEELRVLARDEHVVAVGEIGLDYHYDHSPRDVQQKVFAELIALAREVKKPIVIHTREAAADTLAILEAEGAREVGGLIHCFSEDLAFAKRALDLGFDLSFSGIVTFKSARAIQEVASFAPEDRILVETDSPYLSPVPHRGKPCEPAFVVHTAHKVAELRGASFESIERATTANAERRFGRRFAGLAPA